MRRIVVLGGLGFFGATVAERLRAKGYKPLVGSRHAGGDLCVDVEDPKSIRTALRPGDVIIDAAGPFQDRTTTLVHSAVETGFDLIDISDSLDYALKVSALQPRIDAAEISVLTSCSSISTATAALVQLSGIRLPLRVTACLVPASRFTANRAAASSLLRSVGSPIKVWRDGRLVTVRGWLESRYFEMPEPIGGIRAYLFESSDSVLLPNIWPSLRHVDSFVHSHVPGLNHLLSVAARWSGMQLSLARMLPLGLAAARWMGRQAGGFAVEVQGESELARLAVVSSRGAHHTAAVPAALAAQAIVEGRFRERGLVSADRHVIAGDLVRELRELGIQTYSTRSTL